MSKFTPGDRVVYVPPHADGPTHSDAVQGVVKEPRRLGVLVDYQDGSPVAKYTKRRNLHHLPD